MKTRYLVGLTAGVVGVAFAIGFATVPVPPASARSRVVAAAAVPALHAITAPEPEPEPTVVRRAIPTERRFDPPPIPAEDQGIAELVAGPDEPAADVVAARWEDVNRRLDELFGVDFPAEKRNALRAALTSWIRDHGRAVRAYYRGNIDQAELTDHVHVNMLGYARAIEATLGRDQYRSFMDLEPGEDPFIVLVPPGARVGGPMDQTKGKAKAASR